MAKKMSKEWERYSRLFESLTKCSYKCSCGKTVVMTNKVNKVVCSECGHYVFKSKKDEFEHRFKEKMRKRG